MSRGDFEIENGINKVSARKHRDCHSSNAQSNGFRFAMTGERGANSKKQVRFARKRY